MASKAKLTVQSVTGRKSCALPANTRFKDFALKSLTQEASFFGEINFHLLLMSVKYFLFILFLKIL